MSLFLITFFVIYGGMHLYFFAKVKSAFPFSTGISICLMVFFMIMILAPIAVHALERYGLEYWARFMSYSGYIWMGVLFIFLFVSLIFDLYNLIIYTGGKIFHQDISQLNPSPLFAFLIPLLVSLGINTYGYFEAKNVYIEKMIIESEKIPEKIGKIRIVQISDVHIGVIIKNERLIKIVEEIKAAEPDILISTGDLVDGQINNLSEPMMLLKSIQPRYGKFAITGNHEFYAGLDDALDFMRNSGFSVLRGEGTTVAGLINIIGMDDPTGRSFGLTKDVKESQILPQFPHTNFTLLLKHQPVVDNNAAGLFDLQLSGHTHKGQIFPFSLITRLFFRYHTGYFDLPNQSKLYVSRGTGTWGPPIRFLAPPEITVFDIVHQKNQPIQGLKERTS
jgi:uncharacterized protein